MILPMTNLRWSFLGLFVAFKGAKKTEIIQLSTMDLKPLFNLVRRNRSLEQQSAEYALLVPEDE